MFIYLYMNKELVKIKRNINKLMNGGTLPKKTKQVNREEEMKHKIRGMIVGNKNEHRPPINKAIQKLIKTAGNDNIGPPDFTESMPWLKKFKQIRSTMHYAGEEKNDPAFKKGGVIDHQLLNLKKKHLELLEQNNKDHEEVKNMLDKLPKPPSEIVTKHTGRGRSRGRSMRRSRGSFGGKIKTQKKEKNNELKELITSYKFTDIPDGGSSIKAMLNGNKKIISFEKKKKIKTKKIKVKKTKKNIINM